jgi:hypothetical protein
MNMVGDIKVSVELSNILPERALDYFKAMCWSWDATPDETTAMMHLYELHVRLPMAAKDIKLQVICSTPTHLQILYTIKEKMYPSRWATHGRSALHLVRTGAQNPGQVSNG